MGARSRFAAKMADLGGVTMYTRALVLVPG